MPSTLREAVRERLTFRAVASLLLALAILRVGIGASPAQLASTVALSVIAAAGNVVEEVYDVRQSVSQALVGAIAVVGSSIMLAFGDGSVSIPLGFLVVGAWFLLDAVQVVRHEGLTEDEPTGREVYRNYVGRRIHEALDEHPHTRRELFDALEADDETVDAALERLQERGVVIQEGSEFRLDNSDDGGGVRGAVVSLARRIARPVTLELKSGDDEPGDSTPRRGVGPHAGANHRERDAGTDGGRDTDREREPERESTDG